MANSLQYEGRSGKNMMSMNASIDSKKRRKSKKKKGDFSMSSNGNKRGGEGSLVGKRRSNI